MDRSESLRQLAMDAVNIYDNYPHATAQLQTAASQIELCRAMGANSDDLAATQRHHAKCRRLCQDLWGLVDELVRRTAMLMPDVSNQLLFVRSSSTLAWHEIPDFDWQAALAELREIQAEAHARADESPL